MILIFGGTTEGRAAVRVVEEAGQPYFYSTRSEMQEVAAPHAERLCGAMDEARMTAFCRERGVRLIVDAAHPFAARLHATVARAAAACSLPVVRYERRYPPRTGECVWCADYDDAVAKLEARGIERLLALTGVQTIPRLSAFWRRHDCRFRVLDREESAAAAEAAGFPRERLLFYHAGDDETALLEEVRPDAVITKESGESGYFGAKAEACRAAGIPLFVVERPPMPEGFVVVTGEVGLRKRIEEFVPGFFPLRSGFTTGACATAAAKGAMLALLTGEEAWCVPIALPCGEELTLPLQRTEVLSPDTADCTVRKDAGDDPDVTNGCEITVRVTLGRDGEVHFRQGEGVGRVTLPGLGIPIGEPAINATPRRMITAELLALHPAGAEVTVSVAGGRELAQRTFNPKLGIVDGISIIGTSGVVRPFSNEAFVASIRKEIEVARAVGCTRLVVNSGAKSERYVRSEYPDLPAQAFVHYGNFIGETLEAAAATGFRRVTMGVMIGKAVKLAEGHLDTHSKRVVMNREFLCETAQAAGCSDAALRTIGAMTLARELWTALSDDDRDRFMPAVLDACRRHCAPLLKGGELTLLLIAETGEIPYRL